MGNSVGQGSISTSPKAGTGSGMPAPPFAANSALNGLSVNGAGQIVLGDDVGGLLAALISDREIEMGNFFFRFLNAASDVMLLDPANDTWIFGDINQTYFYNDAFGFEISSGGVPSVGMNVMDFQFGDYNNTQNKTYLDIEDNNQQVNFFFDNVSTSRFLIDYQSSTYGFGDFGGFNDPALFMTNAGGDRSIQMVSGDVALTEYATLELGNDSGNNESFARMKANQGVGIENQILLEKDQMFLQMAAPNAMHLLLDPVNDIIDFTLGGSRYLVLDNGTENWAIGDYDNFIKPVVGMYASGSADGVYLEAHNAASSTDGRFNIDTGGASNYPLIEAEIIRSTGIATQWTMDDDNYFLRHDNGYKIWMDWFLDKYMFGDCDTFPTVGTGNGTHMNIDDAANTFFLKNTANNAIINMNGVGGFTGTVTPVNSITVNGGIVTMVT